MSDYKEAILDAVMESERFAPKIIPMGANPPLFDGMQPESDGPWVSRVDVAKRLRAALTPMQAAVQKLEWRKLSFPVHAEAARTSFGDYRVGPTDDERSWYFLPEWKSHVGPFASCDEAKAAAQADFDQRIRSALASPPSPAEVTDADVAAAMTAFAANVSGQDPDWTDDVGEEGEILLIAPDGDFFALEYPIRAALTAALDQHGKEGLEP